uniref:Uncharacterized protein n=1 Tax=Cajanus cajan TaxID=3821 RepID=A0A151SJW6_CAJCA|nr:hypothetical protein KK1_001257 [Cajanus cajan]
MSLQLANQFVKHPVGIVEDVLVKVGDLIIPFDFVVLEMEEDVQTPIISGIPFIATVDLNIS